MPDRCAQFPVKIPVFIVFGAVIVQKIFQKLGRSDQRGIKFLGKIPGRALNAAKIAAAFEIIMGKNSQILKKSTVMHRSGHLPRLNNRLLSF
jgi:hypothetical protein